MANNETKINSWFVINLLISYLKSKCGYLLFILFIPVIATLLYCIFYNYNASSLNGTFYNLTFYLYLWIFELIFCIFLFLEILLNFKLFIIFRRIVLTRIKRLNFIVIIFIYNLILILLSELYTFLIVTIMGFSFFGSNFCFPSSSLDLWDFTFYILFILESSFLLTSITILMVTIIKTRNGQIISNFVIIILFSVFYFLNNFELPFRWIVKNIQGNNLVSNPKVDFLNILIAYNIGYTFASIGISIGILALSWKNFKWHE